MDKGPDHVAFSLDAFGESIRLYNGSLKVDEVFWPLQAEGVSEGRYPDGSSTFMPFPGFATPAAPNVVPGADTDGDGIPDAWEDTYGLNRLSAADALLDDDGDGMSNLDEFLAGTLPNSAASVLSLVIDAEEFGVPVLSFRAAANKSYTIMATDSIVAPAWVRVGNILPGADRMVELLDDEEAVQTRFYRIISPMQP